MVLTWEGAGSVLGISSPEQLAACTSDTVKPAGSDRESLHWGSNWVWFPADKTGKEDPKSH